MCLLSLAVWVCTAALAILDRLDAVYLPTLGWWLAERQLPNGGMNRQHEKLEDVCTFIHSYIYLSAAVTAHRALIIHFPYLFKLNSTSLL